MFKFNLIAALVLGIYFNQAMASTEQGEEFMSEQQTQSVIDTIHKMTSAFHQSDITAVMSAYEPGAAVMFEPGTPVSDQAIIEQTFQHWFALQPSFEYPNGHQVFIANDTALHIAPWTMSATGPDGHEISQQGLSVAVLKKQADGSWLMVLDNPHGQMLLQQNQ